MQHIRPSQDTKDHPVGVAQTCETAEAREERDKRKSISNKHNYSAFTAAPCFPRCDVCKWGSNVDTQLGQVYCFNEDSQECGGNVEGSSSCELFEYNK